MPGRRFRLLCIAGLLSVILGASLVHAAGNEPYGPWPGLVQDIFKNRPIHDGSAVIAIEMPYRAEDAVIVPVILPSRLSPDDSRRMVSITLVIDQNPVPMAARFELGPEANVAEIATRVRVNSYADVHAVAELSDGQLYMAKTYVKASGGCARNADEAKGRLGQMRDRQFARAESGTREAQIMIGHPNNSGLQMDQVTQLYIPAFIINELWLWQDDSPVLAMEAASPFRKTPISGSPMFRRARSASAPKPRTSKVTYSGTNGRSTIPGRDAGAARSRLAAPRNISLQLQLGHA